MVVEISDDSFYENSQKFGDIETAVEYLSHRPHENYSVAIYSNVPEEIAAEYLARIARVCKFDWYYRGEPQARVDNISARVNKIIGKSVF